MISHFVPNDMSSKDRAKYGAALVKSAAFDAVYGLWRRRSLEGWTQARVAANVGVDEGWLSKQFVGPRNWTMDSFGAIVMGLNGEVEIVVRAIEDQLYRANYDAYSEYESCWEPPPSQSRAALVPPQKKSAIGASQTDPTISNLINKIVSKNEAAPIPVG